MFVNKPMGGIFDLDMFLNSLKLFSFLFLTFKKCHFLKKSRHYCYFYLCHQYNFFFFFSITFLGNFFLEKFDIALASRRYINVSNLIQFLFTEPLVKRIFILSGEILKIKKSILKIKSILN